MISWGCNEYDPMLSSFGYMPGGMTNYGQFVLNAYEYNLQGAIDFAKEALS